MREKIDVLFCLIGKHTLAKVDTFVSQWQTFLCSYQYLYTRRFIFFWAVLFLNDSYKSARVIDNASQDLHAFLQIKNILSHYSSFPIV